MPECPECGTSILEGHAICPDCDTGLTEDTRTCTRCGETVAAQASACPTCGRLEEPVACERHPDRETKARCSLCMTPVCPDCDFGDRRYHRCEDHRNVRITEGWAHALALADEVEARLIEDNLRADGVPAQILSKKDHSAFPVEFGDLSRILVLVPTYAYAEADRILAGHTDSLGEVSFGCPHCGEPFSEGERVCGACGEALL